MGLPPPNADGTMPPQQPLTQPSSSTTSSPADRPSPNTLPPEAIELASKIFDLARTGSTQALTQYLQAGIPANLTNTKGDTLLMLASYHGHADTARALLSAGADPDALNERGQSILAGAVFKGHDDIVKLLVDEGRADVNKGQPSAVDSAKMFKREAYLRLFGVEDDGRAPWEAGNGGTA